MRPLPWLLRLAAAPCAVWAHAVLRLCPPLLSCPLPQTAAARYRYNKVAYLHHAAPLPNCTKTHLKSIKKRQKARFLCGISPQASRSASTDSTLKSPASGAFWAAVDAARKQKRYLKPSHMVGGAHPVGRGGKAPKEPPKEPKKHICNRHL